MFSVPDIMVVSVLALLLFGPDQLPKMMRQFGRIMREVQNTSQGFIAEMERAADPVPVVTPPPMPPPPELPEPKVEATPPKGDATAR
ncbi:MAG: twin-arginine translocase TatA/TatE family subunit [bacterium]|nr:twin-arginine translocase TatA/TatE family subunit [bacterium]